MEKNVWQSILKVVEGMLPSIITAASDLKFTPEEIKNLSKELATRVLAECGKTMTMDEAEQVFKAAVILIKVAKS